MPYCHVMCVKANRTLIKRDDIAQSMLMLHNQAACLYKQLHVLEI